MDDRKPMPAAGGDGKKGAPDGVNIDNPSGRGVQGESGGGNYPDGRDHSDHGDGGFPRHGGQSHIGYHGGGQAGQEGDANPNAATRGDDDFSDQGDRGPKPGPKGPDQTDAGSHIRTEVIGNRTVEIEDTSGIAAAEASGMIGTQGQREADKEAPGSG